jgi:hypothetical protein
LEKNNKCLGIYLGRTGATVVLASFEGQTLQLWNCFTIPVPQQSEQQEHLSVAQLINIACSERQLDFDEVAIAIDCGMYTQHNVHSEFTNTRQIAQTIRFDAEEALATDASKLAIAFNTIGTDESGSTICVYSANRNALMDTLADLQNNKIDPVAIEPDAAALIRFIQYAFPSAAENHPFYAMLGRTFAYFTAADLQSQNWQVRTLLIGANLNRTTLVLNQIPMTLAMFNMTEPVDSVRVFDSAGGLDISKIAAETQLAAEQLDLPKMMQSVAENCDPMDFAIACGSALGHIAKTRVDFRQDFMPYQGKKIAVEKTLKVLCISATLMLLAVGLYFQLRLFTANSYLNKLQNNLKTEYTAVFGKAPVSASDALSSLKRELIRVQKIKSGQMSASGEASISALLTYTLEALNKAPNQVQMNIDYITVGSKSIVIAGDTASRENTLALFGAIDGHEHLKTSNSAEEFAAGRDKFRVTVLPKESSRR